MKFKHTLPILILIIIVGCSSEDPSLPDIPDFHSGTEGLSIKFLPNLPPNEVWENSEFIIGLELQNKGPTKIDGGIIVITGFDPNYILLNQKDIKINLQEKGPSYPEGDYNVINIPVRSIAIPEGSDSYSAGFTVRAYYDYQTEATANVCIDPNIYTHNFITLNKACEAKEIILTDGQGAPIALTNIITQISPSNLGDIKVQFSLTIKNKGGGQVLGKIKINDVYLGNDRIDCNLKEVPLKDKKADFECQTNIKSDRGSYLSPLTVFLSYKYTQKLDKNIKIKTLPHLE